MNGKHNLVVGTPFRTSCYIDGCTRNNTGGTYTMKCSYCGYNPANSYGLCSIHIIATMTSSQVGFQGTHKCKKCGGSTGRRCGLHKIKNPHYYCSHNAAGRKH